jgi:Holliday junction resolvase RusA-like endonuclease
MTISVSLPMPPSLNSIWKYGRKKVYLDPRYRKWKDEAGKMVLVQHAKRKLIKGNFTAYIMLDRRKRRNSDCDNRAKAVLDFMQHVGFVENDKLCDSLTVAWGPVDGCLVEITPAITGD